MAMELAIDKQKTTPIRSAEPTFLCERLYVLDIGGRLGAVVRDPDRNSFLVLLYSILGYLSIAT